MQIQNIPTNPPPSEITIRILYANQSAGSSDLDIAREPATSPASKPTVITSGPARLASEVAIQLGAILRAHGFYNYAGEAAMVSSDGQSLGPLTAERFRVVLEKHVTPTRGIDTLGSTQAQSLSLAEARDVVESELFIEQLHPVDHVNTRRLPVLDSGGTTLKRLDEGYDARHRVLTARPSVDYATDKSLAQAKSDLAAILEGFPYRDESKDKAALIGAMLTAFVAELFPPKTIVPAFLFDGDRPGLGKNILVQLAMVPVLGAAPASVKAKDEEEMRKLLLAVARDGRRGLFLDNVSKLSSASLESFITTPMVAGRVLGRTETITCPKSTVVYATGNNCQLSADMQRRTIIIRLVGQENPTQVAPANYLDEPRINELCADILGSLFALVREWVATGRPKPTQTNPNFVRWSEIVGGIVEYAGFGLPY